MDHFVLSLRVAMMTSTMRHRKYLAAMALVCTTFGAPGCSTSKDCSLLACGNEGVNVEFTYKDAGTYVVDVTVDGVKSTCTATLPLQQGPSGEDACVAAGIFLTRVGSALPVAQQSIGGLVIATTNATSIGIRITRDGNLLKETTFSPSYTVTPGPNGPDCAPKECKGATFALQ